LLFFDLAIPIPRRKPVSIARIMRTICDILTFQKKSRKIMICVFWMRIIKHRTAKTEIKMVLGFISTPPPSARFAPACRIYLYQQLAEKSTKLRLYGWSLRLKKKKIFVEGQGFELVSLG
jgi:putative component of membrane protein insertase Oxa1/YidC/SpoIIIJ protein YidD